MHRADSLKHQKELMSHEHHEAKAMTRLQAIVRGFIGHKKVGWMIMFTWLHVSELQCCKVHESLFKDACTSWKSCFKILERGLREIACTERLVLATAMADRALANALWSITQDTFLDNGNNIIQDGMQQKDGLH